MRINFTLSRRSRIIPFSGRFAVSALARRRRGWLGGGINRMTRIFVGQTERFDTAERIGVRYDTTVVSA